MRKLYEAPEMDVKKYIVYDSAYVLTTSFTGGGEDKDLNVDDTIDYFGGNK